MTGQMKAVVVSEVKGKWELQDRDMPQVGPDDVLVRIRACGICGTDQWITQGVLAFRDFPLVLGHEAAGEVVAVGEGVTKRKVGDRVGVFMSQKMCGVCDFCHEEHPNSFVTSANCANPRLTGVTVDGAHAEYVAVDAGGTVLIPDGVSYEQAAPIICAGYTVWAGLRRAEPKPGARVAVSGIGGLGHLAIQYAKAAGFHVTALTHSADKEDLARQLGADEVVADGAALKSAGGADVLLHTNSSHGAVAKAMEGLRPWGKVVLMGIATDELHLPALALTSNSYQVIGSAHNTIEHLVEALDFVARGKVSTMIETFPKERAEEARAKAAAGEVRFKAVITY
ncbi:alcohol dehydrogenase catalytic domain-containing protein [Amycolatopsis thermoflava]|uniref:alcohol dehydrogenase catalytic domain-containing protein n=1 Tax=Amycolatopsis thermoflava TaxID=84480 RepID=UPI0003FF3F93|nr:alcohol dehydrogenase catalytic domain-containing protein [Amycolatopsis thermoflava]